MKYKTTVKAIKAAPGKIVYAEYCGLQSLLRFRSPVAYTSGCYGWNFDVYEIDGVTICTGYRGMPGKRANNSREYEKRAREILDNYILDISTRQNEIDKLLHEFVAQA